jgi:GDP-D-mannose 3', 5'-epimerase
MTQYFDKIYVTGAAGMIGSSLCRHLLATGCRVIGVDNLWRGTSQNLAELRAHPNFEFRHADIISDDDWYQDIEASSALVHTADIVAGIGYVFSNEWRVYQKNLLINTKIARIVSERVLARFIYLGTACSYPQGLQRSVSTSILNEQSKFPADPESGYGWSKLMGEVEFRLAIKGRPTKFITLDLHNVYGWPCIYSDQTAQVIPSLIYKALSSTDGKLTVWGDGRQGRAFVHVQDVVHGIEKALRYSGEHGNFMLGPDHCTTIGEVARLIQKHPRVRIDDITFDTTKPTGDIGRYADASLARSELGWDISVPFESGLNALIDNIVADIERNTG